VPDDNQNASPFETGPFVKAAFICERMLEERDGVPSFIRVVDRLQAATQGPSAPSEMPPITQIVTLVVCLVAGEARGSSDILIRIEYPSGLSKDLVAQRARFAGEEMAVNIIGQFQITFPIAGLYWLDILVDGRRITRVPYRVEYTRTMTAGPPAVPPQ